MSNPEIDALITNIKLPCGIKKITLYDSAYNTFNDAIITQLDKLEELEELYICLEKFNSPMENLPLKLKILTIISNEFAQSVNTLPENLKYLYVKTISCRTWMFHESLILINSGCLSRIILLHPC
mgnify:CR=1 FL=1